MKKLLFLSAFVLICSLLFLSCLNDDKGGDSIPLVYKEFYNYPAGRVNSAGLLTITNDAASPMLLFYNEITASTYIGTVGKMASVKIQLPDEKFYQIIAVDKADYEKNGLQTSQCRKFIYYSSIAYAVIISSSDLPSGDRNWVLNNNTSYWVKVIDLIDNNIIYTVLAPMEQNVTLPLSQGQYLSYTAIFMKEIVYNGTVIAMIEFAEPAQSNIASADSGAVYTTTFNSPNEDFELNLNLNLNLNPMVLLIINTGYSLRVYKTKGVQLTNGTIGTDWTIVPGDRALVAGFCEGDDTADIYLWTPAWTSHGQDGFKKVNQSLVMHNDKVYQITVSDNGNTTEVVEIEGSQIYN